MVGMLDVQEVVLMVVMRVVLKVDSLAVQWVAWKDD